MKGKIITGKHGAAERARVRKEGERWKNRAARRRERDARGQFGTARAKV